MREAGEGSRSGAQAARGGKDLITCQGCDEKVPLIDFIEQRLKSDPVARKILAMEETATRNSTPRRWSRS